MKTIIKFILIVSVQCGFAQPYLGQTPPGSVPQIFAPGIVSLTNRLETYPAFSPDGKDMYFSVVNSAWTKGVVFHTQERSMDISRYSRIFKKQLH